MDRTQILGALQVLEIMAHRGNVATRATEIVTLGAEYPDDIEIRHRTGVALAAHGYLDQAIEQFKITLTIRPRFAYSELEIGNIHVQRGELDEAARWFDTAILSKPDFALSYMAAGRLAKSRGQNLVSLIYMDTASVLLPENPEILHDLVDLYTFHNRRYQAAMAIRRAATTRHLTLEETRALLSLLTGAGRYADVLEIYAALVEGGSHGTQSSLLSLRGHAKLALEVDRDQFVIAASRLEKSDRWRSSLDAYDIVQASIRNCTPLAVIRLGDSEARFILGLEARPVEPLTPSERFAISDEIWRNWFGTSISDIEPDQIGEVGRALRRSVLSADILGVPTSVRLAEDSYHFGYLAYMTQWIAQQNVAILSDAFLNLDFHKFDRFLARLLDRLDWIGAISPHPDLARRLASYLGIPQWQDFLIPGEQQLPEKVLAATTQRHFPERFNELISNLTIPRRGAVVLVAAGLLGKIYCEKIKLLGGIAIDIGSVADAWMGYNTRPGSFEAIEFWRLPSLEA